MSAKGIDRVVRYCNGWIPVGVTPKTLPAAQQDLKTLAEKAGRKASDFPISIFGAPGKEDTLSQFRDQGVDRAVVFLPSAGAEKILPMLDGYAKLLPKLA